MSSEYKTIQKGNAEYPALLREIPDAPEILYIRGILPSEKNPCVAIVGTRKATTHGKELAKAVASELVKRGVVIVSGLALGIDAAAHEGALAGNGKTVAVLGNGIDTIYPNSHESLGQKILAHGGAVLSEYSPGVPAYPSQFLARNRIVSGLSIATVIIEAPARSGTLVTAKHALDQGREVFVFPGPAGHPNYKGSNELIRSGARLVTSAEDILEDLSTLNPNRIPSLPRVAYEPKNEAEALVMQILSKSSVPLAHDKLIAETKIESSLLNSTLTFLTLEGVLEETRGRFTLKNHPQ